VGALETAGVFGTARSRDKDAPSEFLSTSCDSDLKHASPHNQQEAWNLNYSKCTKPGGQHAGCGYLGLLERLGSEAVVPWRLKVKNHPCTRLSLRHNISVQLACFPGPIYSRKWNACGAHSGLVHSRLLEPLRKARKRAKVARSGKSSERATVT
jgi:hypothetical protein